MAELAYVCIDPRLAQVQPLLPEWVEEQESPYTAQVLGGGIMFAHKDMRNSALADLRVTLGLTGVHNLYLLAHTDCAFHKRHFPCVHTSLEDELNCLRGMLRQARTFLDRKAPWLQVSMMITNADPHNVRQLVIEDHVLDGVIERV